MPFTLPPIWRPPQPRPEEEGRTPEEAGIGPGA
jgi:hypothetical protein